MSLFSKEALKRFEVLFNSRYVEIRGGLHRSGKGDRANVSAHWNRWLKTVGARVVRGKNKRLTTGLKSKEFTDPNEVFLELVALLNYENESVSGHVMVKNPDRLNQWVLFPRDVLERALVIGFP